MTRTHRILLLLHSLTRTGAPQVILDAFDGLRDAVDVRILAMGSGPMEDRCRSLGKLYFPFAGYGETFTDKLWRRLRRSSRMDELNRELAEWQPDLIYVNSVAAWPLFQDLRDVTAPVLVHVHELESYLRTSATQKDFLTIPARYIAVSDAVRSALMRLCHIPEDKIALVHEFVPEKKLAQLTPSATTAPSPAGPWVVGGAGTISLRKGSTLWLQMARELRKQFEPGQVRFSWLGVSNDETGNLFHEMVEKMDLTQDVELIPITPDPLPHIRRFDVFAMTSWEDPFPIVVLEAMGMGIPVACFARSGGAPEQVGDTGCVVEDFDPVELAHQIAALLKSPEQRSAMGVAARQRVLDNFTDRTVIPKIQEQITVTVATGKVSGKSGQ